MVLLWWGYCSGDTVVVVLLWWYCVHGTVVMVLWSWYCGHGTVVVVLWWRCCGDDDVVMMLWRWCCCSGKKKPEILIPKKMVFELISKNMSELIYENILNSWP